MMRMGGSIKSMKVSHICKGSFSAKGTKKLQGYLLYILGLSPCVCVYIQIYTNVH